ncbi:MAG: hypothetical protein GX464_03730 [Holophagae bacterium]|nr:hypothetical protein [Holophagae bacterium]
MNVRLYREQVRKALTYVRAWDSYWQETLQMEKTGGRGDLLGAYPLDFRPRLREGHYPTSDFEGVPMWPHPVDGRPRYFTTAMTSCALALWHHFVVDGDSGSLHRMLRIARRLLAGCWEGSELHLLDDGREPLLSAMSQGEAMSVLCRAWQATGEEEYRVGALACLGPFRRSVEDRGVIGRFSASGSVWFEELTTKPLHHILNGMVYAIWGLQDLASATGNLEAFELSEMGVQAIETEIGRFDLGWWSSYWVPEPGGVCYPASAMYHSLHICQLRALGWVHGRTKILAAADRFRSYASRPLNRLRAAYTLLKGKRQLRAHRAGAK